jgi:hypothetical protein
MVDEAAAPVGEPPMVDEAASTAEVATSPIVASNESSLGPGEQDRWS